MTKASVTRLQRRGAVAKPPSDTIVKMFADIASLKKLFVTLALRLKDVEDKLGIETFEVPEQGENKSA